MGHLNPTGANQRRSTVRAKAASTGEGSVRLGIYLRKLRQGYGYTLRKVEEQAIAFGEAIDNSQLSRFEKGKAVPSFEKLRALAQVFNVPVQSFSDVLDLEEFHHLKPEAGDYSDLLRQAKTLMESGEPGQAYVTYERALEVVEALSDEAQREDLTAEVRWRMAVALKSLGKLYMTEQELREILKRRAQLAPRTRLRALLQLSYLYRELGDLYLASVLARECLELARAENDLATQAGVLNTLGNILHDEGDAAQAVASYDEAREVLQNLPGHHEMLATVLTNLGGCLVTIGRFEDGVELLHQAHSRARDGGFRRVAALALTRLAEAAKQQGDRTAAQQRLAESDALASRPDGSFHDIMFLNAYHRWQMVRDEENGTGEKIAFGRLRHLRSLLQRRFPEVDEFDRHVESTRR